MKSSFLNIHEAVLILTIVESLLLCLALRVFYLGQKHSRNLLTAFFLLIAGTLTTTLLTWNPDLHQTSLVQQSWIPALLSVFLLMEGPILYAWLSSLGSRFELWRWLNLIHLLPSVIVVLVILLADIRVYDWLPWHWAELSPIKSLAIKVVWAIVRCWPLVYVVACFYAEYRLRKQMHQLYSTISWWELRWADIVLGGFFIHWIWSFAGYFAGPYLSAEMNDLVGVTNNYFTVILVNGLFVFALLNGRQLAHGPGVDSMEEKTESKEQEIQDLPLKLEQINAAISRQKLYLDSQINLERFAEKTGIRPRELSAIINSHYQQNFFEFINSHRIEEAKQLLADPGSQNLTVLDIVFQSGFNSQSAFQRFFKRLVGMAPSEYRRSMMGGAGQKHDKPLEGR